MVAENHIPSTRRGVLALIGTTAVTGCSGIPRNFFGQDPVELDGAKLQALADRPVPSIPERTVVDIEQSLLDSRRKSVRQRLSAVPTPFSSQEIPNGAIREKLASVHERTRDLLDEAKKAETPYETLTSLRNARSRAAELNAAWQAIDAGLTREALLEDAATARQHVRTFDDRWQYMGDDAIRAVLIGDRLERNVEWATRIASVDREELAAEQETPITVGELGGDIERARALLDDSTYLYDRYTASLTNPSELQSTIQSAAKATVRVIETRQNDLPEFNPENPAETFDQDIEDTPAAWALQELYDPVADTHELNRAQSKGQPAHLILQAQSKLARIQAFSSLYERVDDGEYFAIKAVSDVEALRSTAIQAVTTAQSAAPDQHLARRILTELVGTIRYADQEFADLRDKIEVEWIARDVSLYVITAAIARAIPDTVDHILSIITHSSG